jgi:hypothetical protein
MCSCVTILFLRFVIYVKACLLAVLDVFLLNSAVVMDGLSVVKDPRDV